MRTQAELEEWRIKLRQIKAVHEDLDEKESARQLRKRQETEAARRREEEQAQARRQAELEAEEREQRETEAEARRQARRQRIQRAKDAADQAFLPGIGGSVPRETRAAIKREIEEELSALRTLDELSQDEVNEIAEGIAARHHRPLIEEEKRRREEERRQREEEAEAARQRSKRQLEEVSEKLKSWGEQLEREEKKEKLVRHGNRFAVEELGEMGIRPGLQLYNISEKVKKGLQEKLTSEESKAEVEDLVETIIAEELEED